jgi:electron transfer flavoprotein beta subunit
MAAPCVIGAGKGLNNPKYPTFPDIVKSRKKEVKKIGLAELAIQTPAAGMQIQELVPAAEQRTPKRSRAAPRRLPRRWWTSSKTKPR